jgi:bifunctional non-homologous end joining protein LigD
VACELVTRRRQASGRIWNACTPLSGSNGQNRLIASHFPQESEHGALVWHVRLCICGPAFPFKDSDRIELEETMKNTPPPQSISLYYREGNSDKVYHVQLVEREGGCVVNFQYGRRGSTLQTGTKIATPVTRYEAEKTFAKLVAEKKAKGYTEGESGTPYSGAGQEKTPSGYLPQLSNSIQEQTALILLEDDAWLMQEKADGVRQIIIRTGDRITASNRKGLIIPLAKTIEAAVRSIPTTGEADFVLDGEAIGDSYVAFDVLRFGGLDICGTTARARFDVLDTFLSATSHAALKRIRTAFSRAEKWKLFTALQEEKAEGVVFKRLAATYMAGRPAWKGDHLKFKFYATATLGIIAVNDKRSVQLGAWTPRGWQFVGNVTIPGDQEIPKPLTLAEVRYLYRYPDGSLYQPTYLIPRTDKHTPDALTTLKLKPTTADDERQ